MRNNVGPQFKVNYFSPCYCNEPARLPRFYVTAFRMAKYILHTFTVHMVFRNKVSALQIAWRNLYPAAKYY